MLEAIEEVGRRVEAEEVASAVVILLAAMVHGCSERPCPGLLLRFAVWTLAAALPCRSPLHRLRRCLPGRWPRACVCAVHL